MLFVTLAKYLCNILIAIPPDKSPHTRLQSYTTPHNFQKSHTIIHPKTDSFRKVSSHI